MTPLQQAKDAHTDALDRYVNSSWAMGPTRRDEVVAAAARVRELEQKQEEARDG